jgi:signal transduction histidine kinase
MTESELTIERRRPGVHEERRLRSIIDHLADGIVIVGADGLIRFANPAATELFARAAKTLVGTELGFPIATGKPAEVELVRPDGRQVTAELRVVEISWEGDAARLVSVRDITDRRRAEENAREAEHQRLARAEAEAANHAKSEFLATMSHELRTPLNAVIGYAQLLDLGIGGGLSPEQHRHVSRILSSSRHLLGVVSEVLDLAKVDAGRLKLRIDSAIASRTADAAAALVQPSAEARAIGLGIRGTTEGSYLGDEDRVRQIIANLLSNAVKFTAPGGNVTLEYGETTSPEADARVQGSERWVYFTVDDTGVGIPAEHLAGIFEPFVQVTSGHTRPSDGTGLGLTISRRLARMMQGDITVRSTVGKGSRFTLWVPGAVAKHDAFVGRLAPAVSGSRGLASVGELITRNLQALVEVYVTRLRAHCPETCASTLRFSQIADHIPSLLADLGGVLVALDESQGQLSTVLIDATEIQRAVAGRHGAQRASLDWTADAIRCEYRILGEEIERLIEQQGTALNTSVVTEALTVLRRLLTEAEQTSLRAFRRARGASDGR